MNHEPTLQRFTTKQTSDNLFLSREVHTTQLLGNTFITEYDVINLADPLHVGANIIIQPFSSSTNLLGKSAIINLTISCWYGKFPDAIVMFIIE